MEQKPIDGKRGSTFRRIEISPSGLLITIESSESLHREELLELGAITGALVDGQAGIFEGEGLDQQARQVELQHLGELGQKSRGRAVGAGVVVDAQAILAGVRALLHAELTGIADLGDDARVDGMLGQHILD